MSRPERFTVDSEEAAARALEYFNGFHDGFIKRIAFESQDRIEPDLSQSCTGCFEAEIDFAHYNYADGTKPFHPYNQIVRASFRNAQDIFAEFRDGFLGNTIIRLAIVPADRSRAPHMCAEPCMALDLMRNYYVAGERRYELREQRLFTFSEAVFVELEV